MTIESWLPALLGYFMPIGLFLLAWGGMEPERARRSATAGALALALGTVGYFATGFAFHLGGAGLVSDHPGLEALARLFAGEGGLGWGLVGLEGFFLAGDAATPEALALFFTYLPTVVSAVLLTVLSLSGQTRGWQTVVTGLLVGGILFPVAACWTWGGGWLANLGTTLERGHGFVDHGGSGTVYLLGGTAALGALTALGRRLPCDTSSQPDEMPPAHFPLLANLGALLFGLGWLGWSISTPFHATGAELSLPHIAVNGLLAGAGAILAAQCYSWFTTGSADALMSARGMVAGFIAVSAGAPFVPPLAALVIGLVAGALLPVAVYVVERLLLLPDATATAALGVPAGAWGLLAVALFSNGRWGRGWNGVGLDEYLAVPSQGVTGFLPAAGLAGNGQGQMVAQLVGLGAIALSVWLVSWIMCSVLHIPYRQRGFGAERASAISAVERHLNLKASLSRWKERKGKTESTDLAVGSDKSIEFRG